MSAGLRVLGLAWLWLLAVTLHAAPAAAARVIVLTGPVTPLPEPGALELLHQLTAELGAEGFDVVVQASTDAAGSRDLEAVARRGGAVAALRLGVHAGFRRCEVWLARPGARGTLRSLESPLGEASSRTMALRVVELVRASSLELELELESRSAPEPPAPRSAPARPARPAREEVPHAGTSPVGPAPRARLGASCGAVLLLHPGGVGGSVAPTLGLMLRLSQRSWLELRGAGPALGLQSSEHGSAEVDQQLLLVGLRFEALSWQRLGAHLGLGAGGYRLGARGSAAAPYTDGRDAQVVAALGFGAGLHYALVKSGAFRLSASGRGDALFLTPRPVLRFAGNTVASSGQPGMLATLAMEAAW